ncbi:MAG: peptidoglycan recognition family protein [Planctomycetota bacterium]|nr:peptidoglycan recognition family protein [Planctomycetota bacterium]
MFQSRAIRTLAFLAAAMFLGAVLLLMMNTAPIRVETPAALSSEPLPPYHQLVLDHLAIPLQVEKWRHIVVGSHLPEAAGVWQQSHFVIETDARGQVQVRPTPLWRSQQAGRYSNVPGHDYNADGIGISLAGDFDLHAPTEAQMDALAGLVRELQTICNINHDRVYLYRELTNTPRPGAKFQAHDFHTLVLSLGR